MQSERRQRAEERQGRHDVPIGLVRDDHVREEERRRDERETPRSQGADEAEDRHDDGGERHRPEKHVEVVGRRQRPRDGREAEQDGA